MNKLTFLICVPFLLLSNLIQAQDETQESTTVSAPSLVGTIESQFDYAIQKSNNFQDYKVVKLSLLNRLKANSVDSILRFQKEAADYKKSLSDQQIAANTTKKELETANQELIVLKSAQDNVDFLGASISKTSYNLIMWSIILGLALLLIVMVFRVKSASSYSKDAKETYAKLENDFEDFKRRAMEKEQKLGRQLVDEVNKHKKATK